jgi:chromosome segregation ATPase
MKPRHPNTTNQDLFHTLMQFHREIAVPDMQRMIDKQSEVMNARFDQVYTLFDGVFGKFDRLESELVSLKGGLARVEARLTDVETRLTNVEARLDGVESRLSSVESELQLVKNELARFERWRSALEARFDASESDTARDAKIAEINEQLTTLSERVAALETRH